jgi:hypothetical protein
VSAEAWALASEIWSAEAGRVGTTTRDVIPEVTASASNAPTRLRDLVRALRGAPGSDVEYCSA